MNSLMIYLQNNLKPCPITFVLKCNNPYEQFRKLYHSLNTLIVNLSIVGASSGKRRHRNRHHGRCQKLLKMGGKKTLSLFFSYDFVFWLRIWIIISNSRQNVRIFVKLKNCHYRPIDNFTRSFLALLQRQTTSNQEKGCDKDFGSLQTTAGRGEDPSK